MTTASKTQFVDVPSVSVGHLRERGVVIRCSDFTVGALRSSIKDRRSKSISETLPIIRSDKRTFNIPDDLHNPAFQVGVSLYFYPDKHGNKFLGELIVDIVCQGLFQSQPFTHSQCLVLIFTST